MEAVFALPLWALVLFTIVQRGVCGRRASVCGRADMFAVSAVGENGVRVRVAVPGSKTLEPPLFSALLPAGFPGIPAGAPRRRCSSDGTTATYTYEHGNIETKVWSEQGKYRVLVERVSDRVELLRLASDRCSPATFARRGSFRCEVHFLTTKDQVYYGFGEHRSGVVGIRNFQKNLSDSMFYGKSRGADVLLPTFISSLGFNFVWNLPSLGGVVLDSSSGSILWTSEATQSYDFWISTTPSSAKPQQVYEHLFRQYIRALGKPIPMPWYATGFIQSKNRYRNQTQLLEVAWQYKRRKLPISMIVVDYFHWNQMGDMSFNERCWPNPHRMVAELKRMGIELMVTFWPFIGMNVSKNWKEYSAKDFLVKNAAGHVESFWGPYLTPTGNALIDATNEAALNRTFAGWYEGYGRHGIESIWLDETEPDHAEYIGGGQWVLREGTDKEILPAWVYFWTRAARKEVEKSSSKGGFILARSAWLGAARHGIALWSGDINSSWTELRLAIRAGQSVGLSGIPLWTTDIGGYAGGYPKGHAFQELVVRWFQFGAFCPLFRLHGQRLGGPPRGECGFTNGDNEVWTLAQDTQHYEAIQTMLRLRQELRSYVQAVNLESAKYGLPMMRPMFLEFPLDQVCTNQAVEGQFMLGSRWLISPVTVSRAKFWDVYLPRLSENERWVYWFNKSSFVGGGWHSINVRDVRHFPLFYRTKDDIQSAN